jgi:glycosyltransferase involved in cell wall biosynthesis
MAVKARMRPCDVFVGMSGIILEASEDARARFGAQIVVDRGSRHILSQAEILARLPGAEGPSAFDITRELAGYAMADRIALPSRHAVESFKERGISEERIIYNPYGVDLASFCPAAPAPAREPDLVLFVGLWCLRKGVDLLTAVIERSPNLRLLHAGAVGDVPFPEHPRMQSLGHIDQTKLSALYAQAAVAVLPSREDGYGLVLCQALACGTPIVASDRTGAPDLAALIARPEAVTLFASGDEQALDEALASAISAAPDLAGQDLLGESGRAYLSWEGYGQRYARAIAELTQDQ